MAREQLSYALPGEELYVVKDGSEDAGASDEAGGGGDVGTGSDAAGQAADGSASSEKADGDGEEPGFFESILRGVADLF